MVDIYKHKNSKVRPPKNENSDKIEERNQFPEADKPLAPRNLSGQHDKPATQKTVDFYQVHPYQESFGSTNGLLSLYDPNNPDRQLMDSIEQEAITLASPPIKYYRLIKNMTNINPIYGEAKRRDGYNDSIVIFGNYEDPSPVQELGKYGINIQETLDIWFNLNYLLNLIGDKLQIGDVIQSYDGKYWECMTSIIIDEALWRAQHNNCKFIKLQREGIYLPDVGEIRNIPVV